GPHPPGQAERPVLGNLLGPPVLELLRESGPGHADAVHGVHQHQTPRIQQVPVSVVKRHGHLSRISRIREAGIRTLAPSLYVMVTHSLPTLRLSGVWVPRGGPKRCITPFV